MTAGRIFKDFSQWTSAHGVPHIGSTSNKWLKVFWGVILVVSLCMFITQLIQLIVKYLDYDVTVQTELKFQERQFPAVTMCNINPYAWMEIQRNPLNSPAVRNIYNKLNTYETLNTTDDSEDAEVQGQTEEAVFYMAAHLTPAERDSISYNRTDPGLTGGMMSRCTFDQKTCSELLFKPYHDRTYGKCYTFNFGGTEISSRAGPAYGLRILAVSNQDEYMPITDSVGVRTAIHNHDEDPFMDSFGYNAAAGFTTAFGIKFVEMHRLPYPHGNCTTAKELGDNYDGGYSVEGCFRTCFQQALLENCNCGSPKFQLPKDTSDQYCDYSPEKIACVEGVLNGSMPGAGDIISQCKCAQPCAESSYGVTVSTALWPSSAFLPPECKGSHRAEPYPWNPVPDPTMSDAELTAACTRWFRDNTMLVEVYFERMNYQLLRESEAYKLVNLVSDLGGQLGLWLGVSIITMIECVSFLVMVGCVCCCKKDVKTTDVDDGSSPFDGVKE